MRDYLDFDIIISKESLDAERICTGIEILYIFDGYARLYEGHSEYSMRKNDVILINPGESWHLHIVDDSVYMKISFTYEFCRSFFKTTNLNFECNSVADLTRSYIEITRVLRTIVNGELFFSIKSSGFRYSRLYQLLGIIEANHLTSDLHAEDKKLQHLMTYVYEHYSDHISLDEAVEKIYISKATASRLFYRETGLHFSDFVREYRLSKAAEKLVSTDRNITGIAMDCGFSNASVFSQTFLKQYGMLPAKYRAQRTEEITKTMKKRDSSNRHIAAEISKRGEETPTQVSIQRKNLIVNTQSSTMLHRCWNKLINMGPISNLTRASLQDHVKLLRDIIGFQYIRVWNVFSRNMFILISGEKTILNYEILDAALDFLVSSELDVVLDFGRRPPTGTPSEFWEDNNDFSTCEEWADTVNDVIRHIVKRYGVRRVNKWCFELSFARLDEKFSMPYHSEKADYITPFKIFRNIVKKYVPDGQIGGPACISVNWRFNTISSFLQNCIKMDCIPDYISVSLFPFDIDEEIRFFRSTNRRFEIQEIENIRNILKAHRIENIPLVISEMNEAFSSRCYLNDSCYRGAYYIKTISALCDVVDSIGIFYGSDWITNYSSPRNALNGSCGLLTKDSIRKPAFFALSFLNSLGDKLLCKGDGYIVTSLNEHNYIILCYNCKNIVPGYSFQDEERLAPDRIKDIFTDDDALEINITLNNLPQGSAGNYTVRKTYLNTQNGSILTEWGKFNYDPELSRDDIQYMYDITMPRMNMEIALAENNSLLITTVLSANEFSLINITKNI